MLDYNFFSGYIASNRVSRNKMAIFGIIFAVFIFFTAGGYLFTELVAKAIQMDIKASEAFLNSEETLAKRREIGELKRKVEIINKYYKTLETVYGDIKSVDRVKIALIEDLEQTIPKDVFFTEVELAPEGLKLKGISKSRVFIAELQHNLKALLFVEEVFVSKIEQECDKSENFKFDIECALKDVVEE